MTTQHVLAAAFVGILTITAVSFVGAADRIRVGDYGAPLAGDLESAPASERQTSLTLDSRVFQLSDHWAARGW